MFRSLVALLIICHQVTAYDFSYSELEFLGGSCYPRDSCVPSREDHEDHLWRNYTCECGMHCIRYGTCCIDSEYVDRRLDFQYRGEMCQKLPGFEVAVLLVTRCPDKTDDELRLKCESINQFEDPVMMAPVTSLETHTTYKNYFCALCNHDARDVFLWNIRLEFAKRGTFSDASEVTEEDFLENPVYSDERKAWGVVKFNAFHEVKVKFVVPQSLLKFVKRCYPGMVNECDTRHDCGYEFRYKCAAYYAPIKVEEAGGYARKYYRNIHCAICNNVNISHTDANVCQLVVQKRKTKPPFSFALLLDVNRSDGNLVGKKQVCNDNEKWDPFFKKCRHLSCALPGHVLRGGKCVQN